MAGLGTGYHLSEDPSNRLSRAGFPVHGTVENLAVIVSKPPRLWALARPQIYFLTAPHIVR